eukprot:gnl/MRDRNA2_/MRDRNA2_110162_c0_seq1.p1 gnl/MRDRNA2_/MRDRNA2_110162_c0~~gnl/MRDRNA2_/MRDRNA2_110162_c0_seq1.p1  ORF type:complete len:974 (-),score=139.96 gnl/MRDRNA2_/MRDRNA2_110162_c0_seq1:87-3008(-)
MHPASGWHHTISPGVVAILLIFGCCLVPGSTGTEPILHEPHCLLQPNTLVRSKSSFSSISFKSTFISSPVNDMADGVKAGITKAEDKIKEFGTQQSAKEKEDLIPGIHSVKMTGGWVKWACRMLLFVVLAASLAFCARLRDTFRTVPEVEPQQSSVSRVSDRIHSSKIYFSPTPGSAVVPTERQGFAHLSSFKDVAGPSTFQQLASYTCAMTMMFAPLVAVTVLVTSDMTSYGRAFHLFMKDQHHGVAVSCGFCLALLGYFLDAHLWQGFMQIGTWIWGIATVSSFFIGFMCLTSTAPSIPVIVGITLVAMSAVALRQTVLDCEQVSTRDFSHCCGSAFLINSVVVLLIWLLWVLEPGFGGVNAWDEAFQASVAAEGLPMLTGFLLWSSPMIISFILAFCSMLAFLRSRFHTDLATGDVYVGGELKWVILLLFLCAFGVWIAASLTAAGLGLPQTVIRLSCSMFVGIVVYVSFSVGLSAFESAAEHNATIATLLDVAKSDWVKGFFILIMGPLLPVYFALEVIHQRIRRVLQYEHAEAPDSADSEWLTVQSNQIWMILQNWNWTSVLTKAAYCGLFYFIIQVGCSQGVTIFLSWLNEKLHHSPLPLWGILVVLFFVGQILFLLPPIPGVPIYLVAGVVITEKCAQNGTGLWWGVCVACFFSFAVKMVAIALQQKMIGEHFSSSVSIRKLVGVQTVGIRAVEHILEKKGLHTDKVAVLVGGPDWPTSVLTGILRLHLAETLLGSLPCLFLIIPVVLAATCMSKATVDVQRQEQWMCLAHAMLMFAALTQAAAMIVAGFYLHRVASEHFAELNQLRPEDMEVVEAVKRDRAWKQEYLTRAGWIQTPMYMRAVLVSGAMCMSFSAYLMVMPSWMRSGLGSMFQGPPFRPFTLSDKISDLPGGSLASLVNGTGWMILFLLVLCTCCLIAHRTWSNLRMRGVQKDQLTTAEQEPEGEPDQAELITRSVTTFVTTGSGE